MKYRVIVRRTWFERIAVSLDADNPNAARIAAIRDVSNGRREPYPRCRIESVIAESVETEQLELAP